MSAILAKNVLIADDSSVIRKIFKIALAKSVLPLKITEVDNGPDCRTALETGKFELAFIDVNMPGFSGLKALHDARKKGVKTFTVIMSTEIDEKRKKIASNSQAYDYLVKPFTEKDILRILSHQDRLSLKRRALVVDDSMVVHKVVRKVLETSQFRLEISEALSGAAAFQKCREGSFDIVFMDYNMPGLDGIEASKLLLSSNPDARIILMSTDLKLNMVRRAQDTGIAAFLQKPFFGDDVDSVLHQIYELTPPSISKKVRLFPSAKQTKPVPSVNSTAAPLRTSAVSSKNSGHVSPRLDNPNIVEL